MLSDYSLKDAPLSTKGQQQAETTATNVNRLVVEEDLKPPEAVTRPCQKHLKPSRFADFKAFSATCGLSWTVLGQI